MKKYYGKDDSIIAAVEAIQFNPYTTWPDMVHPFYNEGNTPRNGIWGYIETTGGGIDICAGDWIVKHVTGYFFVCKPDAFERTYEVVKDMTTLAG